MLHGSLHKQLQWCLRFLYNKKARPGCCNSVLESCYSLTPSGAIYGQVCIFMHSNCCSNSPHRRGVFTHRGCLTCSTTLQDRAVLHVFIPPQTNVFEKGWKHVVLGVRSHYQIQQQDKKKKWLPDTRGRNTESLNYHPVTALMLFIREADPVDDRGGGEGSILTYEGRREFPRGAPCYPGFMLFISYPGAHVWGWKWWGNRWETESLQRKNIH